MAITIEKPTTTQVRDIARICSEGWRLTVEGKLTEEYIIKNVDFWYNLERVKRDIQNENYTYVAVSNGKVAGVIGGVMTGKETCEIFVLYVDETYRYQGIGRRLLKAFTNEQITLGAKEQRVSVQEGNQHGIPFYEARGFIFQEKRLTKTETGEEQVSLRYMRKIEK